MDYQDLESNQRYLVNQLEAILTDQDDVIIKRQKIEVLEFVIEDIKTGGINGNN